MFRVAIGLPPLGGAFTYNIASMAKIANSKKRLALYNHLYVRELLGMQQQMF